MSDDDGFSWLKQGSTSSEEVARYYDAMAATYDSTLQAWDYRAPDAAAAMLGGYAEPDASVLDAGCGTGLAGLALRRAGFDGPIDGIDLSPASVERARRRGLYRRLAVADMQELPLALDADAYDATFCIGVMTYIPDGEDLLREFARVTRAGGHVLFSQRQDLFAERSFDELLRRLDESGVCETLEVTPPRPYLPANPDFGDDVGVIYVALRALG